MMDRHELFAEKLEARLNRADALPKPEGKDAFYYLSEDCVRYDYFSAMLEAEKGKTEDLVLEYPHPNRNYGDRKEIDCVVLENGKPGRIREAVEFKYFKEPPNSAAPRLLNLGGLFADFYRLLDSGIEEKTAVLVSRETMNDYISDKNNGFDFLFNTELNKEYRVEKGFFTNCGKTVPDTIREKTWPEFDPYDFSITRIFEHGLPWRQNGGGETEYVIAVFRVKKL